MSDRLRNHQQVCLEALNELHRICIKYNIRYFLIAGSTLGAVRHKGFIPWDDDIDIGLIYSDFYKLRKILPNELDSRFDYIDDTRDPSYVWMFGKILYNNICCIDIFLIARWTDKKIAAFIHWQIRRVAVEFRKYSLGYTLPPIIKEKVLYHKVKRCLINNLRYITYRLLKPVATSDNCVRLARWNEKYFENKQTQFYINLYSIYPMHKEMIRKEWVEHLEVVEFEGHHYPCIGHLDEYLAHLYGDYMVLPPEKERFATHFRQNQINE